MEKVVAELRRWEEALEKVGGGGRSLGCRGG